MQENFSGMGEELREMIDEMAEPAAESAYTLYEAYQEAGFSEKQAFELVKSEAIDLTFEKGV